LMKLGAAHPKARAAWRVLDMEVAPEAPTFSFALHRNKLRDVRRREGRYLLRSTRCGKDAGELSQFYIQLVDVEAAFKSVQRDHRHASPRQPTSFQSKPPPCSGDFRNAPLDNTHFYLPVEKVGLAPKRQPHPSHCRLFQQHRTNSVMGGQALGPSRMQATKFV